MCNEIFVKYSNLKKHVSCDVCDEIFPEEGNLEKHTTSIHAVIKTIQCIVCETLY